MHQHQTFHIEYDEYSFTTCQTSMPVNYLTRSFLKDCKLYIYHMHYSEYLNMIRTCCIRTNWVDMKFKGSTMTHPLQQDESSRGVIRIMPRLMCCGHVPHLYYSTVRLWSLYCYYTPYRSDGTAKINEWKCRLCEQDMEMSSL